MKTKSAEQLIAEGRALRLTHEEKTSIKASLLSVIESNPFYTPISSSSTPISIKISWSALISQYVRQPIPAMLGIVLIIAASGGSITYAAKDSLPGEFLYSVKVSVLEEVPVLLAFSYESKAKWEALRAERRLAEAEALAVTGTLDPEAARKIAEDFSKHVARIDRWNKEAHESHNELADNMQTVLIRMQAVAEVTPALANTEGDAQFAAEAMRDTARASIDGLRAELRESHELSAEESRIIRIRLNAAERAFREGDFHLESNELGQAYILYQEAKLIIDRTEASI